MSTPAPILVVDDDFEIVRLLRSYLEKEGFLVLTAHDGDVALHIIRRDTPALVILDIMIPGHNGWEVTKLLRGDKALRQTPIIMLTARIEDTDKIVGLELGADDYITKPFNPREVVARVRSVLRRSSKVQPQNVLQYGELKLYSETRDVYHGDKKVMLTPTEFNLLSAFLTNPNFVLTRANLAELIFGASYENLDRSLDTHIRNLRKKIEPDPDNPTYIHTVYGVGYRLAEEG